MPERREYADRLDAVAVSDAMVERACEVYDATPDADGETDLVAADPVAMRAALEAVMPDEQTKDADK